MRRVPDTLYALVLAVLTRILEPMQLGWYVVALRGLACHDAETVVRLHICLLIRQTIRGSLVEHLMVAIMHDFDMHYVAQRLVSTHFT